MDIFIFLVFGLSHLLCGMQSQPGIDSALRGTLTNGPALLRTYDILLDPNPCHMLDTF